MSSGRTVLKSLFQGLFGVRTLRSAAFRWAARQKRGLILVYHRVAQRQEPGVVSSISPENLHAHLTALRRLGAVLPLSDALDGSLESAAEPRPRLQFAVTFDDDYVSHLDRALPILDDLGVHATFFLNGRVDCLGAPYWWQLLEEVVIRHGFSQVQATLGSNAPTLLDLAAELESTVSGARVLDAFSRDRGRSEALMSMEQMAKLAEHDIGIGFHGRDHRLMVDLDDSQNRECLELGRAELSRMLGRRLDMFAYPHGKADAAAMAAVRQSDYRYAFTGAGRSFSPTSDSCAIPRWDPSNFEPARFEAQLALRLLLPTG